MLGYHGGHWTSVEGTTSEHVCLISSIQLASREPPENPSECVDENKLTQMPELNPPAMMPCGNVGTPTLVFLDLIQQCLLPQTFVKKLQLKFPKTQGRRLYGTVDFDYGTSDPEDKTSSQAQRAPPQFALVDFHLEKVSLSEKLEVSGPKEVCSSTQSTHQDQPLFSSQCDISSSNEQSVNTANDSGNKQPMKTVTVSDSSDGHTHDLSQGSPSPSSATQNARSISEQSGSPTPLSASIHGTQGTSEHYKSNSQSPQCTGTTAEVGQNTVPSELKKPGEDEPVVLSARERKRREKAERQATRKLMQEGIEERLIAIDRRYHNDDDAEEWDRHEASEDDPSNQERNTERLYEQEEETPWEKGGPGVVFYTDAIFWQAREGDFDEKTTDDLDVDFSAYEEPGAGDKDIKDFLKIRQEQRYRSGYDSTDRFSVGIGRRLPATVGNKPSSLRPSNSDGSGGGSHGSSNRSGSLHHQKVKIIGDFEQFTKGVGRRVMERQGWQEGQGLGSSRPGIKDALRAEGQGPHNKRGLGFHEPPAPTFNPGGRGQARKRQPPVEPGLISTVYDDPGETDPKIPLLQRAEPTALKHRQSHLDWFSVP